MIPVDLRLAKMLVLGAIFKCLSPGRRADVLIAKANLMIVLTIAALLSSKPLFNSPLDKRDESKKFVTSSTVSFSLTAFRARESFARARSDLLTDVNAYDACVALRGSAQRQFCEQVCHLE
jgi:ATP-dependent RNA helicase DHX57